jgi:hypothetical protein
MKRIFFLLFFAALSFVKQSAAQGTTQIINNSGCDICVWVVCWENPCSNPGPTCCSIKETPYLVKAGTARQVPDCGGCTSYILHQAPAGGSVDADCYKTSGPGVQIANPALNNCGGLSACPNGILPQAQICGATASANVPGQVLIQ